MHGAVPEVLPGVEEADSDPELDGRNDDPVDGFRDQQFPHRKRRYLGPRDTVKLCGEERVMAAGKGTG